MHIHNVYFWLKEGLSEADVAALEHGLDTLTHDPAAKGGYYGKPAATDRGVVDNSYHYGLVVVFDDLAAHDAYQTGDVHQAFVAAHADKWARVLVYDVEVAP